jgi:hypothetical protein
MLYTRFVGLTEGLVKWSTLTWKGSKRNAPDTPPMEVKKETPKATTKGTKGEISTPDTGKYIGMIS